MQPWNEIYPQIIDNCRIGLEAGCAGLIRAAAPLALALAAGLLLRNRDAQGRSWIYRMGMAGAAVLIALSLTPLGFLPARWTVSLPAASPRAARAVGGNMVTSATYTSLPARVGSTSEYNPALSGTDPVAPEKQPGGAPVRPEAPARVSTGSLYVMACTVWIGGVLASLAWLSVCHVRLRHLCRNATPARDPAVLNELQTLCRDLRLPCPVLLLSAETGSPFVTGLLRPCIVLPSSMPFSEDRATQRAVLAHEMHHIASGDIAWTLAARLLCAMLWPQPLIWAIVRRWRQCAEEACDRAALDQGCSPQSYARCLLAIAEAFATHVPRRAAGLGMADRESMLGERVEQILGVRAQPARKLPAAAVGFAGSLFVIVSLLACRAVTAQLDALPAARPDTSPSPNWAARPQDVAAGAASNPRRTTSGDAHDRQQAEHYRRQLEAAQRALTVARVQAEQSATEQRHAQALAAALQARIASIERRSEDVAIAQKRLAVKQQGLAAARMREARTYEIAQLRKAIVDREIALEDLQQTLQPTHPRVLRAKEATAELRRRLHAAERRAANIDTIPQADDARHQADKFQAKKSAIQQEIGHQMEQMHAAQEAQMRELRAEIERLKALEAERQRADPGAHPSGK